MSEDGKRVRLVHVENDLSHQELIKSLADRWGLELNQFTSPEEVAEAIRVIGETHPDIVLTDLHLRKGGTCDRSGYEVARAAVTAGVAQGGHRLGDRNTLPRRVRSASNRKGSGSRLARRSGWQEQTG
jgi:CheY-like chemotaxis protein